MESGVKLILNDLKKAIEKGVKIRIPQALFKYYPTQALYLLFQKNIDLRFYNNPDYSFHPKAYIFHDKNDSEIYIGSSNLSKRNM